MRELRRFLNGRVIVKIGDITREDADAIVNAANSTLLGGGGVDGAIHRNGGREILDQCKEIRKTRYPEGLPTGQAVITTAGKLKAKYVIHTVGPVYGRGGNDKQAFLASCYRKSLELARETGLATIAFPAVSTGVYGYPREEAARVCSQAIAAFLAADSSIREVRLVFFGAEDAEIFLQHATLAE